MKKCIAMLLATVLLMLSFTACSEEEDSDRKDKSQKETTAPTESVSADLQPTDTFILNHHSQLEPGTPENELDPQEIYQSLEYNTKMLYGEYRILGGDEGEAAYAENTSYIDYQLYNYKMESITKNITAVPYMFTAGKHTLSHVLSYDTSREFMRAYFYTDGNMTTILCAYTVHGNTLSLTPLAHYEYDRENSRASYILSETVLTYTFAFEGRKLTLTNGTDTVELYTGLDVGTDETYIHIDNYLTTGSPRLHYFDKITLRVPSSSSNSTDAYIYGEGTEYKDHQYMYAAMEENGRITITMQEDDRVVTRQFVYIYCRKDGLILTDGTTTYYYGEQYADRYGNQLQGNLSFEELAALESMDSEKLEELIETKADLLADLAAAYENAGIPVTINEETGEIAMDAAVLFPVNGYEVSPEGEVQLEQFIALYNSVVFQEKYEGFISKIMVEGHTDSDGDYASNQTLSQNRAESVKAICLKYGGAYTEQLTEMLHAVGYSSDRPILDAQGNEDKDASRRVCFRFLINLEG